MTGNPQPRGLQTPLDTSWHRHGACTTADPELFYHPEGETGPAKTQRISDAAAVCNTCPVLATCRTQHMNEQFGVWGGLSEDQRQAIRSGRTTSRTPGLEIVPVRTDNLATKGHGLDPGPVAAHVARLIEAGTSATAIARFAGMAPETVRGLVRGKTQHITHITAHRLLSIRVREVAA